MASVKFERVTKIFGEVTAVASFDLSITAGEFIVLVGPSGCGKTTSLRMLAGLERVSHGRITVADRDVTDVAPKDRDMAMVFQNYALYPHMTVAENVGFALSLSGASKVEIVRRVREAADLVEIGHLLERKPRELSGGQRQRVAVCRAIVRSPKAFLFDEPLSNLDTQLRNTARTEIRALQRRLGTTTVYVTHDQVEAMTMADRIVIMKDGHVQQIGTPIEIFEKPATLFVGTFIGTPGMNVLAPAADGAGGWTVAGNPMPPIDQAGDQIAVGVRPEDVGFEPADADPSAHVIEGVEVLGTECLVHAARDGRRVVGKVARSTAPALGARVRPRFKPDAIHLFHAATGRRLDA